MKKKDKVITYNIDDETVTTNVTNFLDIVEKSAAKLRKYAYVVLEHHYEDDEYIHGVYTNREAAEKKKSRLQWTGDISILKFRMKGV